MSLSNDSCHHKVRTHREPVRGSLFFVLLLLNVILLRYAFTGSPSLYWLFLVTLPLLGWSWFRKDRKRIAAGRLQQQMKRAGGTSGGHQ